ncbi:SDR family oxidoreductase [Methylomonas methanica]|uniref:NAD-dependent epimerase/dehydratase n=1 Tax=Methylomonas methanica (strain DSM 25384 / MC09) TaxID=857087 RepID=G0A0E5_METMM|nr:SDR family oxidoreductase [Methylomonas methanica]AEG02451.1 NAD-dependent epimerase/dehydratase [Methylomonas methanica MC09]
MNILLTGATGFIGNAILRALLQQGHQVKACCRHPDSLLLDKPALTVLPIDYRQAFTPQHWLPHLTGIDAIVNCVGIIAESSDGTFDQLHRQTPIALFQAGAEIGVKKIVQISALGADENAETAYHLSKKAADDALRRLPLDWFLLQPSIVYGGRAQSSGLFHALAALPVHLLPDGGRQLLQPIPIDDVAAAVTCCLEPAVLGKKTLALVGPEPISYADWLQSLRRRLGKPPARRWPVSSRFSEAVAGLGKWLGEPVLSKDNIVMLNRGNAADPGPISELLGRPPRDMASQLFEKPASQAERWHAMLYFVKPLLCLSIAFVWLWSGITSLLFYPHELSYRLLADISITGIGAPLTLYGLAALDIVLGLTTLARFRPRELMLWQFCIVLGYSLAVAVCLPEFVFHPFGPLLKNLPFLICLVIYRQLEGEKP